MRRQHPLFRDILQEDHLFFISQPGPSRRREYAASAGGGRHSHSSGDPAYHRAASSRGHSPSPQRQRRSASGAGQGETRIHSPASRSQGPAYADGQTRVQKRKPAPQGGRSGPPRKTTTKKMVLFNLLKALLVVVCIGIIAFSVVAFQICSYVADATADDDILLNLDDLKIPQNGYILAKNPESGEWVEYQKLVSANANSDWVPLEEIPQSLMDAVISTEDREFYTHGGFSFSRTVYAAVNELFGFTNTFGASTINQQLVKNLTGEKEVVDEDGSMLGGYKRKVKEIFRARFLNNTYSKDMILEAYLNTLPLSGTIVGVQAGAEEYFNKDVGDLTLAESAMIAGITQAPGKYNPFKNPDNALQRRDDVLTFMLENSTITQAEYEEALAQPLGLHASEQSETETTQSDVTSYFSDAVFREVIGDLIDRGICETEEEAVKYYYTSGLRIQSTVDLTLQSEMERVYELGWGEGGLFPAELVATAEVEHEDGSVTTEEVRPQSAMAVVRYDGTLAGVVGGIGQKQESLGLNRAVQSPRPIGSTMKPLAAYSLGIDYGAVNYSSMIQDSYVIPEQNWPVNYGPTQPSGQPVLVCDAVAESLNTVPAHIGELIGVETMYEHLEDTLEISSLVNEGATNDLSLSPLVLGGMTQGVTAAELAAAYAVFGGDTGYGAFTTLHSYEKVLDKAGNVVLEPEVASIQAVSTETGYVMNRLLSNVLRSSGPVAGTASGMALTTTDSVGKTGTTSDDKDRWFVGLSPNYVSAVWWGYDTNQELIWPPTAATNPPPNVWRTIIDNVQANMEPKEFAPKPDTVTEQAFCRDTGLLAGAGCSNLQTGYYSAVNTPAACAGHAAPTTEDDSSAEGEGDDNDG